MKRALVIAAIVAGGLLPAPAGAYFSEAGRPVSDPRVGSWLTIAQRYWHATPDCADGIRVDRAERLPAPGIWAAAEVPGCGISLDPDFYPRPAGWGYAVWAEQMCNVIVHEYGHLLGQPHVTEEQALSVPRLAVMLPAAPFVVPACRTYRRSQSWVPHRFGDHTFHTKG